MPITEHILARRHQQVLCDTKWQTVLRRTWLFRSIPFVELVLGSGSLAMGNVDEDSDFDLIVGVRAGRIFTVRFFCAMAFGLVGWRRGRMDTHETARDKICLNHFVTPAAYTLQLPENGYWRLLYQRLVPLYGAPARVQAFFDANQSLVGQKHRVEVDLRHTYESRSFFKKIVEEILASRFGDWVEERLRAYQVRRIERYAPGRSEKTHTMHIAGTGTRERIDLPPVLTYSDIELEFHPDPATIELS